MKRISVLGCGRWGSFIAWYLATKRGKEVFSWGPEGDPSYEEQLKAICERHFRQAEDTVIPEMLPEK